MNRNILAVLGIVLSGSIMFTSCIERNNYNSAPYPNNNNNNYPHNTDSSYIYDETFNGKDNNVWTFTDAADSAYASVTDSGFQYVDYSATKSNILFVGTGVNVADNFTVTTRIKSNNIFGLVFGASGTSNGYAFYVDTAGNYSLYQEGAGSTASVVVIPSTQDSLYALKDNWNTVEMDQVNGMWTFYINGTEVTSLTARALSGNSFGFKVLPATIGYASYLKVMGSPY